MKKNILVVDDSALMRRVICDIIQSDERFFVEDIAKDGQEAYELLKTKKYAAVVLDINMPRMTGLELLEVLQKEGIKAKIIMASTLTKEGAEETMQALELGAVDFVTKPGNFIEARGLSFKEVLGSTLEAVTGSDILVPPMKEPVKPVVKTAVKPIVKEPVKPALKEQPKPAVRESLQKSVVTGTAAKQGEKLVALACSTGGPKSLQSVIPYLPKNLDAPVLLVQHMPAGFTATLAERLNDLSQVTVKEAQDGEIIRKGCVYIAPGGKHLLCTRTSAGHKIVISDEPPRDALKPCANIMYESLIDSSYDEITCVVMTGMGADGTKGIEQLGTRKKLYVIAQDAASSVVYGMPRAVAMAGLVDKVTSLQTIAEEITKNVGCVKWM